MGDLRTELLKIREQHGILTPRIVAEAARPRSHPLHDKVYDVPKNEAAERYYIANAAKLLRVTFRTDVGGRPADLRSFWVVKGNDEEPRSQYVPIEEIIQDPMARTIMLRQMLREWKRFKARYQVYEEFAQMVLQDPDLLPVDPDEEYGENGTEG